MRFSYNFIFLTNCHLVYLSIKCRAQSKISQVLNITLLFMQAEKTNPF